MARFIRVTEMPNGKDLMLNVEFIVYVVKGERDTYIKMSVPSEQKPFSFFFVKETVEEVWAKVNYDNTKPPMIVSEEIATVLGWKK